MPHEQSKRRFWRELKAFRLEKRYFLHQYQKGRELDMDFRNVKVWWRKDE